MQTSPMVIPTTSQSSFPKDCFEIYENNVRHDGIYRILPDGNTTIDVFCDMASGGWTLIQRRINGDVNFNRGWTDYVNGFGTFSGDFWLGLKNIHLLTNPPVQVMIEGITRDTNETVWERFRNFTVSNAASKFTLYVDKTGTYNKAAIQRSYQSSGGLGNHNGFPFSTFDHQSRYDCNNNDNAGWWYANCWLVLINNNYIHMNLNSGLQNGNIRDSKMKIIR